MVGGLFVYNRAGGKFHRVTLGSERERLNHRSIDSRTCMLPNKAQIAEWIEDYGEDCDFITPWKAVAKLATPPRIGSASAVARAVKNRSTFWPLVRRCMVITMLRLVSVSGTARRKRFGEHTPLRPAASNCRRSSRPSRPTPHARLRRP
jgi:hypothetical protein